MALLKLSNDMRVGAIGRTRSGKTFLFEKLLRDQPRVIVVDSKHRVRWNGYSLTDDPKAALLRDKVIYRHKGKVPNEWWEDALEALHDRGGGIIYCDEMAELTSPNMAPAGIKTVFRLGGEIGVGCWWAAQEATGVNNTVIRQSEILCMFMNHGASDRDKLIGIVGDMGEVTAHLGYYEFVVFQSYGQSYDPRDIGVYKYVENGS